MADRENGTEDEGQEQDPGEIEKEEVKRRWIRDRLARVSPKMDRRRRSRTTPRRRG